MKGVSHYKKNGKLYTGKTHKSGGKLMTGSKHTATISDKAYKNMKAGFSKKKK